MSWPARRADPVGQAVFRTRKRGITGTVSRGGTMRVKSVADVKFCLVFQRETLSVPVMRRVLGDTLRRLGVDDESVYDILLAATEACTNVLTHGGRKVRDYAVVTSLGAAGCQVEVTDDGAGPALSSPAR